MMTVMMVTAIDASESWRVGDFPLMVDGEGCRCQRWMRLTMATMMMTWSALETADNGGDDDVVISAGGG